MMSRTGAMGKVLVPLLLMFAACSAPELGPAPIVHQRDLDSMYAQLNSVLTHDEQIDVMNATEAVIEKCMRGAGFKWFDRPEAKVEEVFANDRYMSDFEVWLFDDAVRSRNEGYGVVSAGDAIRELGIQNEESFEPEMTPDESERYFMTFWGTDEDVITIRHSWGGESTQRAGGCLGKGFRSVYGDTESWLTVSSRREDLTFDVWSATIESKEVQRSLKVWAECMRKEGYAVDDPPAALEAVLTIAADATPSAAQAAEISIATADVGCKELSGLAAWFGSAFLREAAARMPSYEDDLARLAEIEWAAAQKADSIVGEH